MIECIYLDMDGVLSDFVSSSLKVAGIPLTHDEVLSWDYFSPFMSEMEFWRKIDLVDGFWGNLRPYPWAAELVKLCRSVAPTYFCSAPPNYHMAASAKIQWLRDFEFMGQRENNYVLTQHKHLLAGPRRVLIDDGEHQIDAFNAAGGLGLTFPQHWNDGVVIARCGDHIELIAESLQAISGKLVRGKNLPGESILSEAERLTGNDRQADYGPPDVDFRKTAGMWTAMWEDKLKPGAKFETWDVPQAMICVKMSRLQHKPKRDSVVDTAGYANCMDKCYEAAGGY